MEDQLEELNLLDIINTIKKEKKIIFFSFFIGLIFGVAWFFLAPLEYEGTIFIEVGSIKRMQGPYVAEDNYIEDPVNLLAKIKDGAYGIKAPKSVNPVDTSLIEINISGNDRGKLEEDFNNLSNAIIESHKTKVRKEKEKIEIIENMSLIINPTMVMRGPDIYEIKPSIFTPLFSAILGLFVGFSLVFIKGYRS